MIKRTVHLYVFRYPQSTALYKLHLVVLAIFSFYYYNTYIRILRLIVSQIPFVVQTLETAEFYTVFLEILASFSHGVSFFFFYIIDSIYKRISFSFRDLCVEFHHGRSSFFLSLVNTFTEHFFLFIILTSTLKKKNEILHYTNVITYDEERGRLKYIIEIMNWFCVW